MTRIRTSIFLPAALAAVIPLIFLSCAGFAAVNPAKPRLAILPFTGGNPEEAEAIAEFFSYENEINRVFTPVPRTSAIETLMKEQQFQRSGLTDSDTIAELGRQLNADYVLAGHIAVLGGSTKLLLITIIDVQELQQIAGDYREYQLLGSAVDDILPDMAKRIAEVTGRRAASRRRPRLAVLPFNVLSSGMDEGDAELLAQLLATELANSGAYAVFPRTGAIERVMEEHHIERSGMTDPESIRVIGAAVNAQYVLSANVRNIEGENYFSALILNIVEASQVPGGTHEKYRTVNDGLTLMPRIAQALTGVASPRTETAPKTYQIGDRGPAGGWVFYDKGFVSEGWRYLEAAPTETEFKAEWGAYGRDVSGTVSAVGTGKRNTELIVAYLRGIRESGKAAQLCDKLTVDGYDDWFLPSKDELDLMYRNLKRKGLGEFQNSWYWSSSQHNPNDSWEQNFGGGSQYDLVKNLTYSVRCVRAF
jgi:TolB-like protein